MMYIPLQIRYNLYTFCVYDVMSYIHEREEKNPGQTPNFELCTEVYKLGF